MSTDKLDWLDVKMQTRAGQVRSKWYKDGDKIRYEIQTPTTATIEIAGKTYQVEKGVYTFENKK